MFHFLSFLWWKININKYKAFHILIRFTLYFPVFSFFIFIFIIKHRVTPFLLNCPIQKYPITHSSSSCFCFVSLHFVSSVSSLLLATVVVSPVNGKLFSVVSNLLSLKFSSRLLIVSSVLHKQYNNNNNAAASGAACWMVNYNKEQNEVKERKV